LGTDGTYVALTCGQRRFPAKKLLISDMGVIISNYSHGAVSSEVFHQGGICMTLPVLIVDDDPQIRSLIWAILSKHGFPMLEARDGVSALSTVRGMGGAITLIVSSFSIPGLDGAALARLVRAQFPNTPTVLMCDGATECDDLCEDAFLLAKPFIPSLLVDTVCRLQESQPEHGGH
jgi:CheY-like chemotaxis protein